MLKLFRFLALAVTLTFGSKLHAQVLFSQRIPTEMTVSGQLIAPAEDHVGYNNTAPFATVAEDFTIKGPSWSITGFRVFGNVFSFTRSANFVGWRIWQGVPGEGGSVVAGDLDWNSLVVSMSTNACLYPPGFSYFYQGFCGGEIWQYDLAGTLTLDAGNYWLEWTSAAFSDEACPGSCDTFVPRLPGTRETDNARRFFASRGEWTTLPYNSPPGLALPFEVLGTVVSEPSTYALMATSLVILGVIARRRRELPTA
jgi:hypothetical protein